MGTHNWTQRCPCCGFEQMIIFSDGIHFEATCQICGYSIWSEEKIPVNRDIELAKQALREMTAEEKEKAIELFCKEGVPLVSRLRKKPQDGRDDERRVNC